MGLHVENSEHEKYFFLTYAFESTEGYKCTRVSTNYAVTLSRENSYCKYVQSRLTYVHTGALIIYRSSNVYNMYLTHTAMKYAKRTLATVVLSSGICCAKIHGC
jgi:hypothetical protein